MKTIDNLQQNQVIWQQGSFSARQDESGQWTATHSFKCRLQDVLSVIPKKGDDCTNDGWSSLKFNTSTVAEEVGSTWAMVTAIYKGATSSDDGSQFEDDALPTFNTSITAQSEPIESHKNFKDFGGAEWAQIADYKAGEIFHDPEDVEAFKKKVYADNGDREEDEDVTLTDEQILLISALDKGFLSYYSPRTTHTARYTSSAGLNSSVTSSVGDVEGAPQGAPELPAGQEWLFMGANTDNSGSVFDIELEWLASGDTGWDGDYYD